MTAPPGPGHGCPPFDPQALRRVGVLFAPHKPEVVQSVHQIVAWFAARGIDVLLRQDQAAELGFVERGVPQTEIAAASDLLLSLGGDGTLLHTARLAAPLGKPILGVNLGGFGFLAAIPQERMFEHLTEVMAGRCRVQARMMLRAEVLMQGERVAHFFALNDVVIAKGAISRLFRLHTRINGESVSDFPADGMIVATPTGSTGYALSAGGPAVDPELRALIITPICPHTLSARTLVVPATAVVTVSLPEQGSEEVHLTADGQESVSLRAVDGVEIAEAPFSAHLVTRADDTFYARLREKLGWGGPR